nr:MAG TPA: hypothetical protein [Caudoviricetes sp.]DAW98369.1 MAG TPA: hypothetical protein [Bacteriophage sp.]
MKILNTISQRNHYMIIQKLLKKPQTLSRKKRYII